jgi:stearoyl-CoA desaturase (Delta-9 desaturase)
MAQYFPPRPPDRPSVARQAQSPAADLERGQAAASGSGAGKGGAAPGDDLFPFERTPALGKALIVAIAVLPLAALAYAIWRFQVGAVELWLLFGLWAFVGLGISLGFHRMLTHGAFEAKPVTKAILLLAGTMALEGPPAGWAATHARHHARADRDGDPHSPLDGFWHAHFSWMLKDRMVGSGALYDRYMRDPIVAFFTRTWIFWTVVSLTLPAVVGFAVYGTLQGAFDCFVWGGLIRVFLLHHTTWSVNSIGHMFGTRPFRTTDRGANNFPMALLGWGEGWHNNHHAFPKSAYLGLKWWQVDPAGWVLRLLAAAKQVHHVWAPSPALQAQRRVQKRGA